MKTIILASFALVVLLLSACTAETTKNWGTQECYKAPIGEQERCLENLKNAYPKQ
jgi:hypothetical protein